MNDLQVIDNIDRRCIGSLNDMWMFNLTERKWTWLKGAKIVNQAGIYGTQGVVTINNEPGARFAHAAAMDPSGQLIFLFGGNMHNPPNYSGVQPFVFVF